MNNNNNNNNKKYLKYLKYLIIINNLICIAYYEQFLLNKL